MSESVGQLQRVEIMIILQFPFRFQPQAWGEQLQHLFQAPGAATFQAETSPSAPPVTPAEVTLLILQPNPPEHKQN